MFLDSNRKLVAVLTAAKTTLDLSVTGDYVDITTTATTPGPINTYTNGVTVVDIVPAPAASTIRKLNGLEIYGRDTAAKTVRTYTVDSTPTTGLLTAGSFVVGYDYQIVSVGTTNFTLIGASANTVGVIFTATGVGTGTGTAATAYQHVDLQLQIDDSLGYTDVQGWYTIDSQGNLKSVQAASATSIANAITTSTEKVTPVAADKVGIVDSVTGLLNWSSFTDLLNFFAAKAGNTANAFSTAALTVVGLLDISNASSGQIKFPATQNASANANTLDDYVEAAWNPTYSATTGTPIVTTTAASSTKIGNQVSLRLDCTITSVNGATGYFKFTTPYTANATGYQCGFMFETGVTAVSGIAAIAAGTNVAVISKYDSTAMLTNNYRFIVSMTYFV